MGMTKKNVKENNVEEEVDWGKLREKWLKEKRKGRKKQKNMKESNLLFFLSDTCGGDGGK